MGGMSAGDSVTMKGAKSTGDSVCQGQRIAHDYENCQGTALGEIANLNISLTDFPNQNKLFLML